MAAQVAWRHALTRLCTVFVSITAVVMPRLLWAQDTSFLSGEALAASLRQNLVWLEADDIGEHGYGVVVGGDAQTLWVVTARHVVAKRAMLGLTAPDQLSQQIRIRFCASAADDKKSARAIATPVATWDSGGHDIALLTVARPREHAVVARALAAQAVVGEPVWLLGSDDDCALVPAQGQVRASADAAHNLRIDFPATLVQGGSSGAPVLSGNGMLGLMKSVDSPTSTVHAMADLQRRVQAHAGARWELVDARKIPRVTRALRRSIWPKP